MRAFESTTKAQEFVVWHAFHGAVSNIWAINAIDGPALRFVMEKIWSDSSAGPADMWHWWDVRRD